MTVAAFQAPTPAHHTEKGRGVRRAFDRLFGLSTPDFEN
jgi:hypothetical protein